MAELDDALRNELTVVQSEMMELVTQEEDTRREFAERLRELSQRQQELQAREHHIRALLGMNSDVPSTSSDQSQQGQSDHVASPFVNGSLSDEVYRLLQQEGQEYHYRDLVAALAQRSVRVPGKNPAINLAAHIHDDPRFVRPKRGVYGLSEWYPRGMQSIGARKRRRHARVKPKA